VSRFCGNCSANFFRCDRRIQPCCGVPHRSFPAAFRAPARKAATATTRIAFARFLICDFSSWHETTGRSASASTGSPSTSCSRSGPRDPTNRTCPCERLSHRSQSRLRRLREAPLRDGGRVDRPCLFSLRNALHPMRAAFVLELAINLVPADERDHFFQSADRRFARSRYFDVPTAAVPRNAWYMRNTSAAKSVASSPPVPARISSTIFFSSFGSFGKSRNFNSSSSRTSTGSN